MTCTPCCVYRDAHPAHRWHRGDVYDDAGTLAGQVFCHDAGPLNVRTYGTMTEAEVLATVLGGAQ